MSLRQIGFMELPRLFVLGAGFSRPAGLPLAIDLLKLVLDDLARLHGDQTHLHWSLEDYLTFKAATDGVRPDPVDIEDFAAFLDHRHFFGNLGSDTWSETGNRDQFLLRWGIGRVLHRRTAESGTTTPDLYRRFAAGIRPMDVIVTFNYDLLLERALDAVGQPYRRFPQRYRTVYRTHGEVDSDADAGEAVLVKVHGSIDWVDREPFEQRTAGAFTPEAGAFARRRDLVFGDSSITPTHPLVEGPRFETDPLRRIQIIEDLDAYYDSIRVAYEHPPVVLPPSEAKQLYGQTLRELWQGLALAGVARSGFSIIGYSLPRADPYALQVMYDISRGYVRGLDDPAWRLGPAGKIIVVDRREGNELTQLRETYRFLPSEHTTWLTDGFDESTIEQLFPSA